MRNGAGHSLTEERIARQLQATQVRPSTQYFSLNWTTDAGLSTAPDLQSLSFEILQPKTAAPGLMDAFTKICQRWRLTDIEQMILLGYPGASSYFLQLREGRAPLISQDTRDRIGYVIHISLGLGALFHDSEAGEFDWLNAPREKFNRDSAIQFMMRGKMTNLIAVSDAVLEERAP
jgi:hypothetical protein